MHTRRAVKSEMTLCILLCFVLLKSMFIAGCLTAASDRQRGSEDVRNHWYTFHQVFVVMYWSVFTALCLCRIFGLLFGKKICIIVICWGYFWPPPKTGKEAQLGGLKTLTGGGLNPLTLLAISTLHSAANCRHAVFVCPSVCLSRSWVAPKRIKIYLKFSHRRVAKPF